MELEDGSQLRNVLTKRHTVLDALLEEAKTKPTLVGELEHSRSTIDRAIKELLAVECIEPTEPAGQQFRATPTGKLALQTYREYLDTTDRLQAGTSILNSLQTETPITPDFISESDIYSTVDPARQPSLDILEDATKLIGASPVVFQHYFDALIERLQDDRFEADLVLESALHEEIKQNYRDSFRELTAFDSIEISITEEQLPYSLWLMEQDSKDYAGITIHENGAIRGLIINDSDPAVRWARDQYAQYKDSSTKIV